MISIRIPCGIILLCLLLTGCSLSQDRRTGRSDLPPPPRITEVETGTLRALPGFTGDRIGAEITDVSEVPDDDIQSIGITIPIDPDRVDRIEVISPSGETIEQQRQATIRQPYDEKNVGIRLYLPKRKDWEFRLRLIDEPDTQ